MNRPFTWKVMVVLLIGVPAITISEILKVINYSLFLLLNALILWADD